MISVTITSAMLKSIVAVENCRSTFSGKKIPKSISARLRKISKKKSTYASNRIEGNPLTEQQVNEAIDSRKRHHLKPEEEVRNYYAAIEFLDRKLAQRAPIDKNLLLETQKLIVKGESREKAGFRQPMPPGVLFAVYDSETGQPEYIPPESKDIEPLIDELLEYIETSDNHPLIKAGIIHYQLVTIHPFEDGNGRTARIISNYYLDFCGFDFGGAGSLEEYFAYDPAEYYRSLQMNLPVLYYEGRNNPPHLEIWLEYFLRMVELYAQKASSLLVDAVQEPLNAALSHLSARERAFFDYLVENEIGEFTPIEMAKVFGVSNRTIINWSSALAKNGLIEPQLVNQRIRSYKVVVFW